ncbi:unnamed protein product [Psylliodes chrysocephalus]|uniref:CCHC-type domain-containing protein n=1 Tax=Psylliodes chrysocephalus TaxID=3402493 RepID=A0A9P0G1T8_9CUCU|nr:unnamed protein product [Psylliodes chrysocephala]
MDESTQCTIGETGNENGETIEVLEKTKRVGEPITENEEGKHVEGRPFEKSNLMRRSPIQNTPKKQIVVRKSEAFDEVFHTPKGGETEVLKAKNREAGNTDDEHNWEDEDIETSPCFKLQESKEKRKRSGSTPRENKKKHEDKLTSIKRSMKSALKKTEGLNKILSNTPKTKVEMRTCIKELITIMKTLGNKIEEYEEGTTPKEGTTETATTQTIIKTTRSIGVQVTEEVLNEAEKKLQDQLKAAEIRGKMKNLKAENDLWALTEEEWPEEAYKKTKLTTESILPEGDVAMYLETNQTEGISRKLMDKYPELESTEPEIDAKGKLAYMVVTTRIPNKGEIKTTEKFVFKIMPTDTAIETTRNNDVKFSTAINYFVEEATKLGRNKISLTLPEETNLDTARKLVEVAAQDAEVSIDILHTQIIPKTKANRTEDRGVVIIKKREGKSYADLLKEVKDGVSSADVEIDSVRQTREGGVLIKVKGGIDRANKIKDIIKGTPANITDVVTRSGGKTKTIHIFGLDMITSKEEIIMAIQSQTKTENTEEIVVKSIRPTVAGGQNATVELQARIAENLLRTGALKVGWMSLSIKERINLQRCFRCQQIGHVRENCRGEDRTNDCLRCGKTGHTIRECPKDNEEYCHNCKEAGHRNSNMRCPIYKRLIEEARKKEARQRLPSTF